MLPIYCKHPALVISTLKKKKKKKKKKKNLLDQKYL